MIELTPEDEAQALRYWTTHSHVYKRVLCGLVVRFSRLVMRRMNHLEFTGVERWEGLFQGRERGLLSFSNHVSLFDDPLLISNLGTTDYESVRWIPADHINFFGNALKGVVFSAGKCVPIIRGGGLEQRGMTFLVERLQAGEWVHIFPEGGRTRETGKRLKRPFKLGIGKLVAEAEPVLMPFIHQGMGRVLPIGTTLPRRGCSVTVRFGHAQIADHTWLDTFRRESQSEHELWGLIRDWSERELVMLSDLAERDP